MQNSQITSFGAILKKGSDGIICELRASGSASASELAAARMASWTDIVRFICGCSAILHFGQNVSVGSQGNLHALQRLLTNLTYCWCLSVTWKGAVRVRLKRAQPTKVNTSETSSFKNFYVRLNFCIFS